MDPFVLVYAPEYARISEGAYVSIRQRIEEVDPFVLLYALEYVRISEGAYVSIMSAYVSIREHT